MAQTIQLLDFPDTFITFDDQGRINFVEAFPEGQTFEVLFVRSGGTGSWGPFIVGPADFSQSVSPGQGKRFEDIQIASVRLKGGSGSLVSEGVLSG